MQLPAVLKAKELGYEVHCFAWRDGAVCEGVADYFYPISIVEKEEILAECQRIGIDGVCTISSDVAAPTVAYIAEKMNLVGNSYEAAVRSHDKYMQCAQIANSSYANRGGYLPEYHLITNSSNLAAPARFPLIVKPVDRSGSLGVVKVYNEAEYQKAVSDALEMSFAKQVIVEQFVVGREISVEFISYKGKHYPLTITDKVTTGEPHFVELEHHQPANLSTEMREQIFVLTVLALDALELTNGASHSEFIITEDNKLYLVEVGGRMGGDFIGSDLVKLSTGYDFVKGVIEVALGTFVEPQITLRKHAGVYFLSAETVYVKPYIDNADQHPEIVKAEITNNNIINIESSSDRSGYFIYQADSKMTYK